MQITYVGDEEAVVTASGQLFVQGKPTDCPDDEATSLLNRSDFTKPKAPKAPDAKTPETPSTDAPTTSAQESN